jgi:hypothetical protein
LLILRSFVDLLAVILLQHPITAAWEWGEERNGKEKLMTEAEQGRTEWKREAYDRS